MSDARQLVGPVLEASELGRAVLSAILELNRDVRVQDRGAYLRVLAGGRCVVTRAAVQSALGRPFDLPGDLELAMPSFKGRFSVDAEQASWEASA